MSEAAPSAECMLSLQLDEGMELWNGSSFTYVSLERNSLCGVSECSILLVPVLRIIKFCFDCTPLLFVQRGGVDGPWLVERRSEERRVGKECPV